MRRTTKIRKLGLSRVKTLSRVARVYLKLLKIAVITPTQYLLHGQFRALVGLTEATLTFVEIEKSRNGFYKTVAEIPLDKLREERDGLWFRAYTAYHESDWSTTVALLHEADRIEDESAFKMGLDPLALRILGTQITGSIGHTSFGLAIRARMAQLSLNPVSSYWMLPAQVANRPYLDYWRAYFPVVEMPASESVLLERALWPIVESIQTVRMRDGNLDLVTAHNFLVKEWELQKKDPLLSLSTTDLIRGNEYLASRGLGPDDWFVTLHVREDQDGLEGYGRNARIDTYSEGVRRVVERGGHVFRLGGRDATPFRGIRGLIDYAHDVDRDPWLDVFLLARSKFLIATTSGPIGVPPTFGVPVLWTNAPDIAKAVYHPRSLMIPKTVRSPNGKIMTLQEMLESPFGASDSVIARMKDNYGQTGYQWVDNTREDIANGVSEMLDGWVCSESREQEQWRTRIEAQGSTGVTRLSQSFASQYKSILNI